MKKPLRIQFSIVSLLIICCCTSGPVPGTIEHISAVTNQVDDERLLLADDTPEDWLSYGRNYQEDRYSPLDQITKSNIDSLGLAWSINLGTTRGIEATPIVVDGIMYLSGPWSVVYAIDARKGNLIWTYDPQVPREYGEKVCCDVINRGVALYKGLVYVGTLDGRLVAIDAASGEKSWEVLTVNQKKPYSITGAPRIVDGKVIIGNGGAEYGVRGYVSAYNALSGDQLWRFYTVPGDPSLPFESDAMEEAAKTWNGEWWKYGGGGTAWDAMAYDPELKLLYVGTGNGSPWNREIRSPGGGDNLYLSSIVALNPDNGELVWHYQTTPGESWDYTATQHIILADLKIKGVTRKVLMQAPKNGFFYVIDRTNGEFISAEPYVHVNWAKAVDYESGRPIETSFSRYTDMNAFISPNAGGGHNWQPMAFNPKTGLVYIPARSSSMRYGQNKNWTYIDDSRTWNLGIGFDSNKPVYKDSLANKKYGELIAWDPVRQEKVWSVKHASAWNAGVVTTSELVFQGTAEGDFIAYDAKTGAKVWTYPLETGIIAAPITYMVDDIQYVSIAVGWGGVSGLKSKYTEHINPGTIYTFSIGGKENLPEFPVRVPAQLVNLDFDASKDEITHGRDLFMRYCNTCHRFNGGGSIPDLTYSIPEIFEIFPQIVGQGVFLGKGMPNFNDRLSGQDIIDVKNYILSRAKIKQEKQANGSTK